MPKTDDTDRAEEIQRRNRDERRKGCWALIGLCLTLILAVLS